MLKSFIQNSAVIIIVFVALIWLSACSSHRAIVVSTSVPVFDPIANLINIAPASSSLKQMGYCVQVGAFTNLDNAVKLERSLETYGIDAYYFRHESGLYKVRFGNHPTYSAARHNAVSLQQQKLIDGFFIVIPEAYAAARINTSGQGDLREELIRTAKRFIGVPYRWGGSDKKNGFDCSGLTMVCYRLNGLNMQRNSRAQFKAGRSIKKSQLRKGDLVFFATGGGKRVSHVGIFIGKGQFIHAPRTGKKVRVEQLSNSFFTRTYVGARSFL
jgi:cell wall-associated NlpC family hydrolase